LITQNIDGLDGKAGNSDYIPIHGRLDKVTVLHQQGELMPLLDAPWDQVVDACTDLEDDQAVKPALLDAFRISKSSLIPEMGHSLKPFVLLFDEYYTDLYRMGEAEQWMTSATRFVFMGTSFSVNITNIALRAAIMTGAAIDVVDPSPIDLNIDRVSYHAMSAAEFIANA
jgi:NAD-dependent deacetylase